MSSDQITDRNTIQKHNTETQYRNTIQKHNTETQYRRQIQKQKIT